MKDNGQTLNLLENAISDKCHFVALDKAYAQIWTL